MSSYKYGRFAENVVSKLLTDNGWKISKNSEKLLEYDIEIIHKKKPLKIEVKYDMKAAVTGNVAIEFYNTSLKSDSGINASAADIWAYYFSNGDIFFTYLHQLKKFVEENEPFKKFYNGGEGNANLLIYKKEVILGTVFKRVNDLSKRQLSKYFDELFH